MLLGSYLLWKGVCSCNLLAKTQLILFLNKCDLLQAKLMRGIKIRDCVPSFGDRKNDISTATKCKSRTRLDGDITDAQT
jgi:guanine nucleotide-binding protein subunit alpha